MNFDLHLYIFANPISFKKSYSVSEAKLCQIQQISKPQKADFANVAKLSK